GEAPPRVGAGGDRHPPLAPVPHRQRAGWVANERQPRPPRHPRHLEGAQRPQQRRADDAQLGAVHEREPGKQRLPERRQPHEHLPTVALPALAADEPSRFRPVDELDHAVVPEVQPVCERSDRRGPAPGQPLHAEEQLMLLRLEARRPRRLLAEAEEPAQLVAELGERTVVRRREPETSHPSHLYRVTILMPAMLPARCQAGAEAGSWAAPFDADQPVYDRRPMNPTMTRSAREAFLADTHVGVLAVAEPGRGPCAVPVWYRYTPGDVVHITIPPASRKARLLRTAARASLCVQLETLPYKYVSVEGPVEVVATDVAADQREMAERYLGPK